MIKIEEYLLLISFSSSGGLRVGRLNGVSGEVCFQRIGILILMKNSEECCNKDEMRKMYRKLVLLAMILATPHIQRSKNRKEQSNTVSGGKGTCSIKIQRLVIL